MNKISVLRTIALAAAILEVSGSASAIAMSAKTKELAAEEYRKSARKACLENKPCFKVSNKYPVRVGKPEVLPWQTIDYKTEPQRYLEAVLQYTVEGNVEVDWALEQNAVRKWFHAPWMHNQREPIHGLTRERGSRWHELSAVQTRRTANWAVGFYNNIGAVPFAKAWKNKTRPNSTNILFPIGTVSAKLLFTDATDEEAPYLKGSNLEWEADINESGPPVKLRLLQVDIAVKEKPSKGYTGWVFGTFYFGGNLNKSPYWKNLVPVGLEWGTSPDFTRKDFDEGKRPSESWINPTAEAQFQTRNPDKKMGYLGRMNGPVDDPRSSCVACHSQAMDTKGKQFPPLVPPAASNCIKESNIDQNRSYEREPGCTVDEADVRKWFRNLSSKEPFDKGAVALDYSLQLAFGMRNWNSWLKEVQKGTVKPSKRVKSGISIRQKKMEQVEETKDVFMRGD